MQIHAWSLSFVVALLLSGCRVADDVESSASRSALEVNRLLGWTGEIPISSETESISFEHWTGSKWERIGTEVVSADENLTVPIYFVPGVDMDREVIYVCGGARLGYRVPSGVAGTIVRDDGIEELSDGWFQILSIKNGDEETPCIKASINELSEQAVGLDAE